MLQKMALGITGIKDSMKEWGNGKVKGLWGIIKGTLFAAFLVGLILFMESEYWDKAKEKLVDFAVWLRDNLWPTIIKACSFYEEYREKTTRNIPVFICSPIN